MRVFISLVCCLVSFSSFTSTPIDLKAETEAVYWIDDEGHKAILYRRFDAYHHLLSLIEEKVNLDDKVNDHQCDKSLTDRLVIKSTKQNYQVQLHPNCLIFKGNAYSVSDEEISQLRRTNQFRIDKGDSISIKLLSDLKKSADSLH